MEQRKGKNIPGPQPVAIMGAAGVLLLSASLGQVTWSVTHPPRGYPARPHPAALMLAEQPAPTQMVPGTPAPLTGPPSSPAAPALIGPPVPGSLPPPAARESIPGHPAAALPHFPALPDGASAAEPPAHGPNWAHAPLPVFSPDLLKAMLDPRAARRALHLRRLGIVPPDLPAPGAGAPPASGPQRSSAAASAKKAAPAGPKLAARPGPKPAAGQAAPAAPSAIARIEPSDRSDAAAPVTTDHGALTPSSRPSQKPETPPAASHPQPAAAPAGEDGKPGAASQAATTKEAEGIGHGAPATGALPIRLQARLDPPRAAYRPGEWVAMRFLAPQPVHLRVYRIDAARHVTRVFSTYSREESGHPARAFSMMVKAGEPQPGPEGMIAIGSARPLTRDELLTCLRAYLSEGPAEAAAGSTAASASTTAAAAPNGNPLPLSDLLQAVIDAVGRASDTPPDAAGPLDRSSWSVAVGRFVSTNPKLSAATGQQGEPVPADGS